MRVPECAAARDRLSGYLDEALARPEAEGLAAHLETCPACLAEYEELRLTRAALLAAPAPPPSPDFWPRLHAEVRRRGSEMPTRRPGGPAPAVLAVIGSRRGTLVMGAALTALLAVALTLRPYDSPAGAPGDDVNDYVTQHARFSTSHPLCDWSRLTFVGSETGGPAVEP